MSGRPDTTLGWMSGGTALFQRAAHALTDQDFASPSHLQGWSRAHVVAHMADNADALVNLLTWARTGIETPMYPSPAARADRIEEGARRPPRELYAELLASGGRLADALAGLPEECWDKTVRTARGREVPASEVAWMRTREVWVHAVDLDAGASFDDVPREICAALLDDVAFFLGSRPETPPVELRSRDDGRTWHLGRPGTGDPVVVSAGTASLAAYAVGRPGPDRPHPARGGLPKLPAWL
jgi:maleylpyruvate isomerase